MWDSGQGHGGSQFLHEINLFDVKLIILSEILLFSEISKPNSQLNFINIIDHRQRDETVYWSDESSEKAIDQDQSTRDTSRSQSGIYKKSIRLSSEQLVSW